MSDVVIETETERKAGMHVNPSLAWHEFGCAKRYGEEMEELCECERLAVRTDEL